VILEVRHFLIRHKKRYSISPTKPQGRASAHDIFSVHSDEDITDAMSPSTSGRRVRQCRNRNSDLENTTSNDLPSPVLATHVDHALISPESLQRFDAIIILGASETLVITADASFAPERRAEAAEPPTQADKAEVDAQNDSVADIISPEARRLNDGRATMETESAGKTVKEAAAREKASRAKEGAFKDKAEKEEGPREEAGREKERKERKAAVKAEQEILKRAERADRARKAKEARKAAADRRRNFGGA
jgi:hypothetical protein